MTAIEAAAIALASSLYEQENGEPPPAVILDADLNIDWIDQGTTNLGQLARAAVIAFLRAYEPSNDASITCQTGDPRDVLEFIADELEAS